MATLIQIRFDEGPIVRMAVETPILLSMLELRSSMQGVSFRRDMKFAFVQDNGRRLMMSPAHISIVEGGLETL